MKVLQVIRKLEKSEQDNCVLDGGQEGFQER